MTRPVAEILEQAKREHWPTSSIDAMANHHLCTNEPVNRWFEDSGVGESPDGAALDLGSGHQGRATYLHTLGGEPDAQADA